MYVLFIIIYMYILVQIISSDRCQGYSFNDVMSNQHERIIDGPSHQDKFVKQNHLKTKTSA